MISFCAEMVNTMQKSCNKAGELAGHGEPQLIETSLLYWTAAYFCRKVMNLKAEMTTSFGNLTVTASNQPYGLGFAGDLFQRGDFD